MPHKLTGVRCEEVVRLVQWRIGDEQSIIAWMLYRGSIPLYDYSLGVRVHPPLCIAAIQRGMHCIVCDNVVDLVYNGSTCQVE